MPALITLIVLFLSIIVPVNSSGETNHINSDSLSADENAALNQLYSVFGNNIDATTLYRNRPEADQMHDATMIVMDIRKRWNEWSPSFKEIASGYFLSKPSSVNDQSRQETLLRSVNKVRGVHLLPNWIETAHFNIEWGNNLLKSDSGADSGKIVSCSAAFNSGSACSGVPDFVDKWADYLEEVWDYETIQLGYIKPVGSEEYLYDVYIANTRDDVAGNADDRTPSLASNYLGLTITYCDNKYAEICKDDNTHDSHSYIVVNNYYANDQAMKITAAHEFFHAIQFSYPSIDKWWSSPDNHWWIEATATWMEELVYDEINNYYSRVRIWLQSPQLSLKNTGTRYSGHEYGDVIFILYLTDVFLKNRGFVRDVLVNDEGGIDALNSVLATEKYGMVDFESAFRGFIALNAVADIGESYGGYEEGEHYGRVAVVSKHVNYPAISTVSSISAPHEFGASYIHFQPPGNNDNRLTIEFDGSDGINWTTIIVKVRSDGTGFERDDLAVDPTLKTSCHSVDGFGSVYSEVFLVASILTEPSLKETAPYSYKADLEGSCPETVIQEFSVALKNVTDPEINDGPDKRCFIATVAFGSSDSAYVQILRDFRDYYLLNSIYGRMFVSSYYSVSPSIADLLEKHPPAPVFVRFALFPVIGIAFLLLNHLLSVKIFLAVFLISTFTLFVYKRKAIRKG